MSSEWFLLVTVVGGVGALVFAVFIAVAMTLFNPSYWFHKRR